MKKIPLTQGKFAIVNDIDYAFLMQWKWFFSTNGYAVRNSRKSDTVDKRTAIYMHRVILIRKLGHSDFVDTDHKNQNRLDNWRSNLRPASAPQNRRNKRIQGGSSKFKGVHWHKRNKRWQAQIGLNGGRKYLGSFTNEIQAAKVYNKAASEHFGKFACLNTV